MLTQPQLVTLMVSKVLFFNKNEAKVSRSLGGGVSVYAEIKTLMVQALQVLTCHLVQL